MAAAVLLVPEREVLQEHVASVTWAAPLEQSGGWSSREALGSQWKDLVGVVDVMVVAMVTVLEVVALVALAVAVEVAC